MRRSSQSEPQSEPQSELLSILRCLVCESRGTEIAEAAAVLPILFMIVLGIFWFGQAFSTYGTITRAAQEGARAAVAPQCTTCAAGGTPGANAFAAIQNVLTIAKLDPNQAAQPSTTPTLLDCKTSVAKTCDPTEGKVCVQESIQLSVRAGGGVGVCGTAVSFQYPFVFWLPFTSLNKRQILLNAQARVRLETH
jgi:Flp pilus assembly protein TadG